MLIDLSQRNSLISVYLAELRNKEQQKDRMRFRKNVERIGNILAYEISKELNYTTVEIETPLATTNVNKIKNEPIVISILRAGLPLHYGLLNFFDAADNAFVAAYRKHNNDGSFEIALQYITSPDLENRTLILADPMLATGASLIKTIELIQPFGKPREIHIAAVVSSEEGVNNVLQKYPDVKIWTAALDPHLNEKGYIVPGLGDAGDLAFGEKMQQ